MIGVVADDITGANDIGIMFTNGGYIADVYAYDAPLTFPYGRPDVLILDTNSRLDPGDLAYKKVRQATKRLKEVGCTSFFNKTCSVFRGNIGFEFDAMLDELKQEFAVVVLGFPKNGRQTRNGIHYVRGLPLAESEFQFDPIHPMHESDLVKILGAQTKHTVGLVKHTIVEAGWPELRATIDSMRAKYNYLIIDVEDQQSLKIIARAVRDDFVLCGSSALAEELPDVLGESRSARRTLPIKNYDGTGILCAAGSLMPQTKAQIAYAIEHGLIPYELDSQLLLQASNPAIQLEKLSAAIIEDMQAGLDVVLYSSNDQASLEKTKQLGASRGLSHFEIGQLVSNSMAKVVEGCLLATNQARFLVAGGETSAAVCTRLGIRGMRVYKEIQPGLPSCYSLEDQSRLFVLKSGSFGAPDFFVKAIRHLKDS